MKKFIIAEASADRTFGSKRLAAGEYIISSVSCEDGEPFAGTDGRQVQWQRLALVFDEDHYVVLNGTDEYKVYRSATTEKPVRARAEGSFFDKFFTECLGKTYKEICDSFGAAIKGKKVNVTYNEFLPLDTASHRIIRVPVINFID